MSEAIVAGLLAGYGIAVPVGAIGVLIVGLAARTSLRTGAAAGLGTATADGLYALAAVIGGAALVRVMEPVAEPLRWISALVLIGLAARTGYVAVRRYRAPVAAATPARRQVRRLRARVPSWLTMNVGVSRRRGQPERAVRSAPAQGLGTPLRAYLGLLGLTLLNPATIVYFGALVLGRQAADGLNGVWFVAAAFAASASWQLLLAGGGSLVGRLLTSPRGRLATGLGSSLVIVALAVWILVA